MVTYEETNASLYVLAGFGFSKSSTGEGDRSDGMWPLLEVRGKPVLGKHKCCHISHLRRAILLRILSGSIEWINVLRLIPLQIRLGLVRNVIQGASDWYTKASNLEGFLLMAKAYLVIDQPLAAIDIYRKGVEKFPNDVNLLLGVGRIYEGLHQPDDSILAYKNVLVSDASNTEAISCIASHFFYNGQPELALVLYR